MQQWLFTCDYQGASVPAREMTELHTGACACLGHHPDDAGSQHSLDFSADASWSLWRCRGNNIWIICPCTCVLALPEQNVSIESMSLRPGCHSYYALGVAAHKVMMSM